ncbi:keratin, type I cytoskeletal 9-like [Drosophila ananassae]|uniref:keratin, type I cytoskeletal 9-like n=1 Tax=Drosophila ananassae TaxID=7217 RepID=UPI001CFFB4F4|nr:keratin, type I cytoskeletal 9-like [Drosophila ananassae]
MGLAEKFEELALEEEVFNRQARDGTSGGSRPKEGPPGDGPGGQRSEGDPGGQSKDGGGGPPAQLGAAVEAKETEEETGEKGGGPNTGAGKGQRKVGRGDGQRSGPSMGGGGSSAMLRKAESMGVAGPNGEAEVGEEVSCPEKRPPGRCSKERSRQETEERCPSTTGRQSCDRKWRKRPGGGERRRAGGAWSGRWGRRVFGCAEDRAEYASPENCSTNRKNL